MAAMDSGAASWQASGCWQTGARLRLSNAYTRRHLDVMVERRGYVVMLSFPSKPFSRLALVKMKPGESKQWGGSSINCRALKPSEHSSSSEELVCCELETAHAVGGGRDQRMLWRVITIEGSDLVRVVSARESQICLGFHPTFKCLVGVPCKCADHTMTNDKLRCRDSTRTSVSTPKSCFFERISSFKVTIPADEAIRNERKECLDGKNDDGETKTPNHILPREALQHFAEEGYLVIKDAVPSTVWIPAAASVTNRLAIPGAIVSGGSTSNSGFRSLGKLDGKYGAMPSVRSLLSHPQSRIGAIVAQLMKARSFHDAVGVRFACQLALRFPEPQLTDPTITTVGAAPRLKDLRWHTDGSYTHQRNYHNFSLLVGVALTDTTIKDPDSMPGNLCVWPKSHLDLSQGPATKLCASGDDDIDYENLVRSGAKLGKYEGLPPELDSRTKPPGIGKPVPVQLRPGDAIVLHPDLAHAAAPNLNPNVIRAIAYFRLRNASVYSKELCERMRTSSDPKAIWEDLPGVQTVQL